MKKKKKHHEKDKQVKVPETTTTTKKTQICRLGSLVKLFLQLVNIGAQAHLKKKREMSSLTAKTRKKIKKTTGGE